MPFKGIFFFRLLDRATTACRTNTDYSSASFGINPAHMIYISASAFSYSREELRWNSFYVILPPKMQASSYPGSLWPMEHAVYKEHNASLTSNIRQVHKSSSKGGSVFPLSMGKNLQKWQKPGLQIFTGLRKVSFYIQSPYPRNILLYTFQ